MNKNLWVSRYSNEEHTDTVKLWGEKPCKGRWSIDGVLILVLQLHTFKKIFGYTPPKNRSTKVRIT